MLSHLHFIPPHPLETCTTATLHVFSGAHSIFRGCASWVAVRLLTYRLDQILRLSLPPFASTAVMCIPIPDLEHSLQAAVALLFQE